MIFRTARMSLITFLLFISVVEAQESVFYMVAHAGPGDPYWARIVQGAQDAASKLGVKVIFSAPEKAGDIAKQVELLGAAIAAHPDGIVTTIPNGKPFSGLIQRAIKQRIPTLAFDTQEAKRDPIALPYAAYIGTDELQAGKKAGERAVRLFQMQSSDSAVILNHMPGHVGLELRTKGINEALKENGIRSVSLDITSNPTKAMGILQSFLRSHPETQVIFTLGPLGYTPAGKVLQERQERETRQDNKDVRRIRLVGFDLDKVAFNLIKKEIMDFTIDSQPYFQAFMAVTQLYLNVQSHAH